MGFNSGFKGLTTAGPSVRPSASCNIYGTAQGFVVKFRVENFVQPV